MNTSRAEVQALYDFARTSPMQYAYQMLLLLAMLQANEDSHFTQEDVIDQFDRFYQRRRELHLSQEKQRGSKQANIDRKSLLSTIRTGPFPRFERRGFLRRSDDKKVFVVEPRLWLALTAEDKDALRESALSRLAAHFGDERDVIDELVRSSFDAHQA